MPYDPQLDICMCKCHTDPDVNHVSSCCRLCKTCNQKIQMSRFFYHIAHCEKNSKPLEEESQKPTS